MGWLNRPGTCGNAVTTAMVDGKTVTIGLNAYIKP